MKKRFKVVKIIDDKSLVINGGLFDGINVGNSVSIVGKSEPIIDPETNDNLGEIDIIKARLNVSDLYEKMCVCESPYVSDITNSLLKANPLFSGKQKLLNVDPFEISGIGDKIIRIGDEALVEISDSEQEEEE